ncbi:T9SS type A sorting domain-containing protein [Pontibacter sp. KCTC 32443]|uniref:T9SS type A sorting domain-containing protein n=1 Tax=Pontibacter TaxID=323449 RepID=UPI00164D391A|nr:MULTISPECIES: T9SS type A sorting domain-containing protein [Pontibacter]MBC5774278.1 T9SS type A sorting domain-containing protein [Pontibacter sp. KCTC 32443]
MKKIFLLLFILTAYNVVAQEPLQFVLHQHVPVTTGQGTLAQPWSGGLNAPQFSTIDLNFDNQPDLFAYDRMQHKVFTWLAVQQNGSWKYNYSPEYEMLFPDDLTAWVLLRDYNCDGLKDIFTSTPLGIKVYKQERGTNQLPKFILAEEAILYNQNVNLQLQSADIPAIEDIDNDGDLDVLVSEFSHGKRLEYYQNMRVENNLNCSALSFVRNSSWWGGITECDGCNNYVFGADCRIAAPLHTGHTGSSFLLLDIDADGDKDLLNGAVQCDELVLMENKGTAQEAQMDEVTINFPANTHQASFRRFPAAYYEDVTFDGIPDLLVAPNLANTNEVNPELQRSVWLYKNKGTVHQPDFEFIQDNFLQDQMLDVGEGAYPAFADIDNDGDLDMLVGNNGAYRNGTYTSTLSYFQNTGTATNPAFTLVTDNYLGLENQHVLNLKPVFADINGDEKADLILTYKSIQSNATTIVYLPNTATATTYSWNDKTVMHTATDGDAPAFFDADKDGDLDMVLGKSSGELQLHTNVGTATNPSYSLIKTNLGGISFSFDKRNLYPATTDVDGDGTVDLITTDDSGSIKVYRNLAAILDQPFTPETELLENPLTESLLPTKLGKGGSITAAALGGPGNLYVIVGTQGGSLYLLQQTSGYQDNPGAPAEEFVVDVYPNLADRVSTLVRVKASEPVAFVVYDAIGKKVYHSGNNYKQYSSVPVHNLKAGIYFLRAVNRQGKYKTAKFVVQ